MAQAGILRGGRRILVLEDNFLFSESIALLLEDHQLTPVGPFARSVEAAQALDRGDVDAALLDLQLRGEESLTIADRLTSLSIPFLFLTGSPDRVPERLRAQVPVLPKSCRPEVLLATIEELLRGGRPTFPSLEARQGVGGDDGT